MKARRSPTPMPSACTQESHQHRKRPSQWPKLAYVGRQHLGNVVLELRNCECRSTLAIKIEAEEFGEEPATETRIKVKL